MCKLKHLAATIAGSGVLALGGVAASAGIANASTPVNGCTATGTLAVGAIPACSSSGMVENPTSITLSVNSAEMGALLNPVASMAGQGIKDSWSLTCYAGTRQLFSKTGTFTVTASQTGTSTNLPLGGEVPTKCDVSSTVSTLAAVNAILLLNVNALDVSDSVAANEAVPGAIWTGNPGVGTRCADVAGDNDGNGTKIQIWTCESDLADYFVQAPSHLLEHDGNCLTNVGGKAYLEYCTEAPDQIWSNRGAAQEVHSSTGGCLTDPSATDGTQLTITTCANKADQKWTIPPAA